MTDDKLYTSLSATTIMAKLANQLEHGVALLEEPSQHIIYENVGNLSSSQLILKHKSKVSIVVAF